MANIIDGKAIALKTKENVREEVLKLNSQGIEVSLAVVIVGDDPASRMYVNNKRKDCEFVGIKSYEYALDDKTTQKELLDLVKKLNNDKNINGILVQLPLPKHLNEKEIIDNISPLKDVDAFNAENVGKIMIGKYDFLPCTPSGCMDLIHSTGIDVCSKNCVVVGRSNIVGKPMAMLLLHESGTVTICHSKTKNLADICKQADILVAAAGSQNLIRGNMIKPGAVVIDVGMNRKDDGKFCGDVNFDEAFDIAGYITPVPGGVGPMTRATLMKNTLIAAKKQNNIQL